MSRPRNCLPRDQYQKNYHERPEIDKEVPDLVLLDIMLPHRDGFAVCESIKANPDCSEVKIIMLSAKSREADREKALSLGADKFITKPFSTRNLKDLVCELMGIEAA